MLPVADAQSLILQHTQPLPAETVPLAPGACALGCVLAEDVVSDIDMPPHDKAMMDGYAVRASDLPDGKGALAVVEEITAGRVPSRTLSPGQASRIMTGAPIPAGADAVIVVESTRLLGGDRVQIEDHPPKVGHNILPRGREMRRGETVLRAGAVLRPQEIGLLAIMGKTAVQAVPIPRVAILATGDELVEPGEKLGPGQIRNSNGPMLLAQTARAGALPHSLGIARDRLDSLGPLVQEGLRHNVLILSGGVSAGKLDLVPGVLREAGVVAHLHKVAMKPGKPFFFGTLDPQRAAGREPAGAGRALVFGLPGNPVSSLVCFELFIRPALRTLRGHRSPGPHMVSATLSEDLPHATDRLTYHPAHLETGPQGWRVRAVPWFGSADLRGLSQANALLVLPVGDHHHRAGTVFPVVAMEMTPE
jgi:molybdopterin molybdotransferase